MVLTYTPSWKCVNTVEHECLAETYKKQSVI